MSEVHRTPVLLPTTSLRFVERSVAEMPEGRVGGPFERVTRRILQQKFIERGTSREVWQDVPVVTEETGL